jgi:ribonucleoside-diphosphate reductase alpha chain
MKKLELTRTKRVRTEREREMVLCYVCGDVMQRAGSCFACPSCGSTSGCS